MAQRSAFFDSQNGDRPYAAADFARLFASLTGRDGVIAGDGDELAVSPTSPASMAVQVGLGSAWIQGRHYNLYSVPEVLEIAAADSTNPRIDRIVVRMDTAVAARAITVQVKQGTPAANPAPPSLTRDTEAWEISLAQVLVEANATEIEAADITDERGDENVCGMIVPGRVPVVDVRAFGAKGDGATNDLSAFNAAMNSLPNGGIVLVPPGTYMLGSGLTIRENIALVGAGAESTVIKRALSGTTGGIVFAPSQVDGWSVRGICFDGQGDAMSNAARVVFVDQCDHFVIEDCIIKNGSDDLLNIFLSEHFRVSGCRIADAGTDRNGIYLGSCRHFVVENNVISNGAPCIHPDYSKDGVIRGNECFDSTDDGISITNASQRLVIADNICHDNALNGIETHESDDCTGNQLIGNNCHSNTQHGIQVKSNGWTLIGNICSSNGFAGIKVQDYEGIMVQGNICRNNGQDELATERAGISLAGTAVRCVIMGNSCFDDQETATQQYGIQEIDSSSTGSHQIAFNYCLGNAVEQIHQRTNSGSTLTGNITSSS